LPHSAASRATSFRSAPWWLAAIVLVALRLGHLGGPLDDPHSWRQCDTVVASLQFYRHGIDLLHPVVCWLGAHRTLLFEFPLVEALSAMLYHVTGPIPLGDRLVALAFFLLATVYFHRIVRRLAGRRPAWLATLVWLALPLGQFYSRAAHVDFAATALAHMLLFHTLRAFERRDLRHAAIAAGAGALAAMIKAPYVLPLLPPLALAWLAAPALVTLGLGAVSMGGTAIAFALWRHHVDATNAAAPDWSFLPGYYKEVNPLGWYFGQPHQRFELEPWIRLSRRLLHDVATPLGAIAAAFGLGWQDRRTSSTRADAFRLEARAFGLAWALGAFVYLLVFFPLNVIHNYYQIPFLAPAALFAGLGLDRLWKHHAGAGAAALALLLVGTLWTVHSLGYYRVDWLRVEAGRAISAHVPEGDLVVASDFGAGYSDPRLLARADRMGWSVAIPDLTPERIARLDSLGARWVAVVTDPDHPELTAPAALGPSLRQRMPILHAGATLGMLELYALPAARAAALPRR
jgi:Dolichyl-phosphate-mannose-protein mannosyltransferase